MGQAAKLGSKSECTANKAARLSPHVSMAWHGIWHMAWHGVPPTCQKSDRSQDGAWYWMVM